MSDDWQEPGLTGTCAAKAASLAVSWWSGSPAPCQMEPHVPGLVEQGRGASDVPRLNELLLPCSAPCPLAAGTGEGTCAPVVALALLRPGCEPSPTLARAPWACHGPGAETQPPFLKCGLCFPNAIRGRPGCFSVCSSRLLCK